MKCYLCNGSDLTQITDQIRSGPGVVRYCQRCDLAMLEHSGGDLKEFYDGEYRKLHGPRIGENSTYPEIFDSYVSYQSDRVRLLQPWLTPTTRLLEIGCSTGHFLYNVKSHVGEVVGVDYDSQAAAYAGQVCNCKTYGCGLDETGLPPHSFDVVCAMQTMEHADDPIKFAKLLGTYLKPGGVIYIEVPSLGDPLLSIYDHLPYRHFFFHQSHLFYMTPRSLTTIMERAGFAGKTYPVQEYNFINHLSWLATGKPQNSCHEGLGSPTLPTATIAPSGLDQELNDLVRSMDERYKSILAKYGTTDNVAFIGAFSEVADSSN